MEDILKFDLPKNQSSYIKVIGLGGGGSNAVNYMYEQGIQGVDFIVCNTDAAALEGSPVPTKIQLGKGLGAGNMPTVAEKAAQDKAEEIKNLFMGSTQMVFITAGMGGGTGTGAAPVVARLLKEIELEDEDVKKILTVAVVTTPFTVEGRKRKQQALDGIEALREHVDSILIINNDKLKEYGEFRMSEAFALANEILTTAVKGISEIITVRSSIQIDFRDVNTVMQNSGVSLMGCGSAAGENRAVEAVRQAVNSPLLNDSNIMGAKNVLLYISSSSEHEITMTEFDEITHFIQKTTGTDVDVIWGAGQDDSLGENLNVTLIATGFSEKKLFEEKKVVKVELNDNPKSSHPASLLEMTPPAAPSVRYLLEDEPVAEVPMPLAAPAVSPAPLAAPEVIDAAFATDNAWDDIRIVDQPAKDLSLSESLKNHAERCEKQKISAQEEDVIRFRVEDEMHESDLVRDKDKWERNSVDRSRQVLRDLSVSAMTKTSEGLAALESVPAYQRRNVTLEDPIRSTDTVVPQFSLSDEGRIVSNSFFRDNVD